MWCVDGPGPEVRPATVPHSPTQVREIQAALRRVDLGVRTRVQLVATFPVGVDGYLACLPPFVYDVDDSTTMGELKDTVLQFMACCKCRKRAARGLGGYSGTAGECD